MPIETHETPDGELLAKIQEWILINDYIERITNADLEAFRPGAVKPMTPFTTNRFISWRRLSTRQSSAN